MNVPIYERTRNVSYSSSNIPATGIQISLSKENMSAERLKKDTKTRRKNKGKKVENPGETGKLFRLSDIAKTTTELNTFLERMEKICNEPETFSNKVKTAGDYLYEDTSVVMEHLKRYIEKIEKEVENRKTREVKYEKDNYFDYWKNEKKYHDNIQNGIQTIKKLMDVIAMKPHAVQLKNFLWNCEAETPKQYYRDKVRNMEATCYSLMVKFAKLLNREGIKHDLPVPPEIQTPEVQKEIEVTKVDENVETSLDDQESSSESAMTKHSTVKLSVGEMSLYDLTGVSVITPSVFVQQYAQDRDLPLKYCEVARVEKQPLYREVTVSGRLHNIIAAEGRGKSRYAAKEVASAHILEGLVDKTRKGLVKRRPLSDEEQDQALLLSCDYIDYEERLNQMMKKMSQIVPQFSQIFNAPTGMFSFRCKALGFNGVGVAPTKEKARRIGAKVVIDKIQEQREQIFYKKYGKKKGKKMLKIY